MPNFLKRRKKDTSTEAEIPKTPASASSAATNCLNCGAELPAGATYCPQCAQLVVVPEETAQPKRQEKAKKSSAVSRILGGDIAQCTNDLVAFTRMIENGLARNEHGRWSRSITFEDTAYDQERRETREDIYDKMCQLHSMFPPGTAYQFNLLNLPEDRDSQTKRAQLLPLEGADTELAGQYNNLIERKQAEGRTEIRKVNVLTFSVAAEDEQAAENALAPMRENAIARMARMQVKATPLDGDGRLHLFHELLRGKQAPYIFDFAAPKASERARLFVSPDYAAYQATDPFLRRTIKIPNRLIQTLHISEFGKELSDNAIRKIRALPIPMNISLTFFPQPKGDVLRRVQENINVTQGEIMKLQSQISRTGADPTLLPPSMEDREADARELRDFLIDDDQQVSWFQGLITIYANSPDEMARYASMVLDEAQIWSLDVRQVPLYQEELWKCSQPMADTFSPFHMRSLTTSESAIMMPWTNESVFHDPRNSYFFVQHANTLAPLFVSPDKLKSPHAMVFGVTGGGKGMLMNIIIGHLVLSHPRTDVDERTGRACSPDMTAPQVFVFDQHGEYAPLADKLDAPVYKFKPGGQWRLNPFDLQASDGDLSMSEVNANADFFMALAQDVLEGALTKKHQSIIDRCLQEVFEPCVGTTNRPTLTDFQEALARQPEEAAAEIALAFESYTTGLMNSFNGQTNVVDAQHLTFYDCSELGSTLKTLAMLSAMQHVRNATFVNHRRGKPTYAIFEEFQVLFENEAAIRMLDSFFSELRKFGLHMICVTQHPTRVLEHPVAKNLFENTGLLVFLPMQNHNADYVEAEFRLSPTQREVIDVRSDPGKGLLIADGMKIPFNSYIDPKRDAELYDLFNTDPSYLAAKAAAEGAEAA